MSEEINDERRARLRSALVRAGREERASAARRASVLAIGAAAGVAATVATTSATASAAAPGAAGAAGATATATASAAVSAQVSAAATGASFAAWKVAFVAGCLVASAGAAVVAVDGPRAEPPRVESPRAHVAQAAPPPASTPMRTIGSPTVEAPTMSVDDLPAAKDERAAQAASPVATASAPAPAPAPASTFAEEMKSAEAIRAAAREGRTADAMRLLDEHDARFKNGVLSEEVEVLRIETLARSGHDAEAKRHAERFVTERPRSPYARRVNATLTRLQ